MMANEWKIIMKNENDKLVISCREIQYLFYLN